MKLPSQMVRVSRVSKWFIQISNGWITLGAIILFLSFMVLVLPARETNTDLGSENVGTPDLSFYYSPNELYQTAEAYGENGRAKYNKMFAEYLHS